ncbi:MAG: hypothetical protein IPJ01_11220 [Micavibrio sp.]|nr:hypothetical protein [Micavibrio sp.]
MKTPEEIKKLAEKYVLNLRISSSSLDTVRDRNRTLGYLSGYEQCQQDNSNEIKGQLKTIGYMHEEIRKLTEQNTDKKYTEED